MANPIGILNGTDCLLAKLDENNVIVVIGGATVNTSTFNTELVDTTNKSSEEKRTFLIGSGEQSADHTLEVLWSQDEGFEDVVEQYNNKSIDKYIFIYDENFDKPLDTFNFAISNVSNSFEKNTPASSSVTFNSSGDFLVQEQFYFAIDINSDDAIDINGDTAIARA